MQPAGFPVATKSVRVQVAGRPTDLVRCTYADATLLFVSQLGAIGTVIQASQDVDNQGDSTFTVATLLGRRDQPLLHVFARQLAERLRAQGSTKPLLLCAALAEHDAPMMRALLTALDEQDLLQQH